jgi:hypothetical protein
VCEAQRTLCSLLLGLSNTHIGDLISQLEAHILPSGAFLGRLSLQHVSTVKRACMVTFTLNRRAVLKEWQLLGTLDILADRDIILSPSTGTGKTMFIILPMLLRPGSPSITVPPLKRLMASQAAELGRYGLRAVIVNEDASRPHPYISQTITTTPAFLTIICGQDTGRETTSLFIEGLKRRRSE